MLKLNHILVKRLRPKLNQMLLLKLTLFQKARPQLSIAWRATIISIKANSVHYMISPVRAIKDSRDKNTDLAPLQPAGSLMLSQAGRVAAAAAGSCRSCVQAGKYWC